MSKRKVTEVNADFIRKAAREGRVTLTDAALPAFTSGPQGHGRGRLPKSAIEAFEAENPGYVYAGEKSRHEGRQVTLPLTKPNARGARLKRPEAFPVSQVRALAGVTGKAGRLSEAEKAKAAEAVMSERGWL